MDKLYEVERLTIFKATSTFVMMQNRGRLHRNTKLFLNSIASSSLTDEDVAEFKAQFAELLNNLVIEITEEEEIDREALERKRRALGNQGALALDDWGSGYSNSNSLLELSPDYIKVDITIICDIDTDADKQQLVKDIVEYAHGRGMRSLPRASRPSPSCVRLLNWELICCRDIFWRSRRRLRVRSRRRR